MADNAPISFHAPPINTIHHPPIITPYNPPAPFFGGYPFYPHPIAHGHMVAPTYWPGPTGLAPPGSNYFNTALGNDQSTLSSPCSSTGSSEIGTPITAPNNPPISFHPPITAPQNPLVSYFCECPFYPPIAHGQFVASSYWPGPVGSAPHGSAYFGDSPRHHYFTRSSSPCSSTGSNETPPDDPVQEDERRIVEGPTVRVNSPMKVGNKEDKPHGMDVASLSLGHGMEELSGACLIKPKKLKVEKLARATRQCHISPTSTPMNALLSEEVLADAVNLSSDSNFRWPPTEEQDAFFTKVLYAPSSKKRLPVFSDICSISKG